MIAQGFGFSLIRAASGYIRERTLGHPPLPLSEASLGPSLPLPVPLKGGPWCLDAANVELPSQIRTPGGQTLPLHPGSSRLRALMPWQGDGRGGRRARVTSTSTTPWSCGVWGHRQWWQGWGAGVESAATAGGTGALGPAASMPSSLCSRILMWPRGLVSGCCFPSCPGALCGCRLSHCSESPGSWTGFACTAPQCCLLHAFQSTHLQTHRCEALSGLLVDGARNLWWIADLLGF